MFYRRRVQMLIIAMLLATLPCVGLASFVRDAQPACAMQMHGHAGGRGAQGPIKMSAHCMAMAQAVKAACKHGGQCSMCDDLSISLAVDAAPLLSHRVAASVYLEANDFLLNTTVASLWRPPRTL